MIGKRKRRHAYRPSDNKISPISAISCGIGAVGLILYFILIQMSAKAKGHLSLGYGVIPWLILIASSCGVFLAYHSMKDTITVLRWKIFGGAINILLVLFTITVFFRGVC